MRARVVKLSFVAASFAMLTVVLAAGTSQGNSPQSPPGQERKEMRVLRPSRQGVSRPIRDLDRFERQPEMEVPGPGKTAPAASPAAGAEEAAAGARATSIRSSRRPTPTSPAPVVLASFGGLTWTGSVPPDTNLAVGDTQVVEIVNSMFMIFDKAGNPQAGPAALKSVFAPLGTDPCADVRRRRSRGDVRPHRQSLGDDPLHVHAQLHVHRRVADLGCRGRSTTCTAIRSDPTPRTMRNSACGRMRHYMSANTFNPSGQFIGGQACAFDRAAMIAGAAAPAVVCFQSTNGWPSLLPSDLDSATPPPAGAPNYFLHLNTSDNALNLYKFHADFVTPSNSTFTGPTVISVAKFDEGCGACVPQPGTNQKLETLASRLMFRLSYHNFGGYESLLVNHAVQPALNSNNKTQTGIRWYEVRNPAGTPVVAQQSTFSPDTTTTGGWAAWRRTNRGTCSWDTAHPAARSSRASGNRPPCHRSAEQDAVGKDAHHRARPSGAVARQRQRPRSTGATTRPSRSIRWTAARSGSPRST